MRLLSVQLLYKSINTCDVIHSANNNQSEQCDFCNYKPFEFSESVKLRLNIFVISAPHSITGAVSLS